MTSDLMKVAEDSARGGFFLISATFIATVITAVTAILVGRLLGPELNGQYALSLVIPEMLLAFAGFGLAQGTVKFAASLRAEGKSGHATKIVKHVMLLRTLASLPFFVLAFVLADFLAATLLNRPDLGFYVRLASISILFQIVSTTTGSAYIGLDKTHYSVVNKGVHAFSKLVTTISLILLGFSVAGAVLGHVAGWIIGGVVGSIPLLFILRKSPSHNAARAHDDFNLTQSFKTLTRFGLPLYVDKVLTRFINPYQNFVLGLFASNVAIGNWKAAANFISLMTVVSIPITTALFPAFSKLNGSRKENVKIFFKFANKYTTLLIIPIATLLIIFSKEIVQIVYGTTYQSANLFLSIHCFLYLLVGLGFLNLKSLFNGLGETRITLRIGLITMLAILMLSPLLAIFHGALGVIIVLIIAHSAGTCYGMYVARRKFQIEFDSKSLIKIYVVGAISAIPSLMLLYVSPLPKLINVVAGGLLYLGLFATLAPMAKIVDNSELRIANTILQRIKPLALIVTPFLLYQQKILNRQEKSATP